MWIGRSKSKLTATEREAMARLRERRATGECPAALSHAVPHTPCELPTFSTISGRPAKGEMQARRKRFRIRHRLPSLDGGRDKNAMCGLRSLLSKLSCLDEESNHRRSVSTIGAPGGVKAQMVDWIHKLKSLVKGTSGVDDDGLEDYGERRKSRFGNLVKSFRTAPMVNFEEGSENERGGKVEEKGGHISDDAYFQSIMTRS